jgi:hypothetical protein
MHLRHKVPTIFNIYMLDVICCALGCVVLLWQVSHQEAEEQTAKAKDSQSEAQKQSDAAVRARQQYEKSERDLLSASKDVLHLQAAMADLAQALALTEKEREDARKLAAKTNSALTLTQEQLKKLEADLAKLLADNKRTNAELTGTQKINAELLAKIALADKQIASLKEDITLKLAEIDAAAKKRQAQAALLKLTEKEREDARKLAAKTSSALTLTQEQLKKLEVDLARLLADNKKTNAELTGTQKINAELLAKIALADKQIASLKGDITLKLADIDAAAKKGQTQAALLKLSEENMSKLQKLLDSLRDDNKDAQAKLKLTELQLKMLEQDLEVSRKEFLGVVTSKERMTKELVAGAKDLTEARDLIAILTKERDQWKEKGLASNVALDTLKLEKDKLSRRVVDLQAEVEQRFAGIPLTGENVVFLIDISGSMTMMDENTDDPEKWPFLCETLLKLMKSIPTLQRFQVILFSDKTSYLFGKRDSWFKYEGAETAKLTRDALKKVKVEGGTNMHDAFEEAFRYRKIKLDTIYLFSDGLPNMGAGVPATVRNPTEAQKNLYMSKFIREKLKNEWNRPAQGDQAVRINAVGFFFESPDVGAFLWAMAREHRGSFVGLR